MALRPAAWDAEPAMSWTMEGSMWLLCNYDDQRQRMLPDIQQGMATGDLERLAWVIDTVIPLAHWHLMDIWRQCLAATPGPVADWVISQVEAFPDLQVMAMGSDGRQLMAPRQCYGGEMAQALGATDRQDLWPAMAALIQSQPLEHRVWIWGQLFQGAAEANRPGWVTLVMPTLSLDEREALYGGLIQRWHHLGQALRCLFTHDPSACLEEQGQWLEQLFRSDHFDFSDSASPDDFIGLLDLWVEGVRISPQKTAWLTRALAWKTSRVAIVVRLLDALPDREVAALDQPTGLGQHPAFQEAQERRRARDRQANLADRPPASPAASRRRI